MKKNKEKDTKLVRSINKNVRSSTRKLNPILKSIVGKKVDVAIRDLTFSDKRISKDIKKTISSAVANAENKIHSNLDSNQKEFIDFVLSKYVEGGVDELDINRLSDLVILKYNTLHDGQKVLGDADKIKNTFIDFQKYLY